MKLLRATLSLALLVPWGAQAARCPIGRSRAGEVHARPPARRGLEAARPFAARPQHRDARRADRAQPDGRDAVLPQPRARQRRQAGGNLRAHHASRLLLGLGQRHVGGRGDQGGLCEARFGSDQFRPARRSCFPLERGCGGRSREAGRPAVRRRVARASCSTPPTSCSAISGCARTSRRAIAASSPSAPDRVRPGRAARLPPQSRRWTTVLRSRRLARSSRTSPSTPAGRTSSRRCRWPRTCSRSGNDLMALPP